MDKDVLAEIGDLLFTIVISYMGALEFLYVVRHLYHWSFRHAPVNEPDPEGLQRLQEEMRQKLAIAKAKEEAAGAQAMQDGVLYNDGFRIDPQQQEIDQLKEKQRAAEVKEQRRRELEAELARQKQIEEETRQQLAAAEAELNRQRQQAVEAAEQEEAARKLLAAEREREEEQRKVEEAAAAEAKAASEENERKLFEAERQREEEQRRREVEEQEAAEMSRKLLEAERERENKQRIIEENARKFMEAEEEMVKLQQQMSERRHPSGSSTPAVEEPFTKSTIGTQMATPPAASGADEPITQTVKTQFGQTSDEPYALTSKPLVFPGVSDEGSSIEPISSQQSSFSTQPSEEQTTAAEEMPRLQLERQEPDGEDNTPTQQYTDEYLRSLDGIKHRPLVREDGSGRRRAFKKRRSSGSSTSSRDSRASREEELRMFTSLEEEEFQHTQGDEADDYTPIKYTSEPTLRVKGHHKRHKRSPVKDMKISDESLRSSLEMLGEEGSNPWGEIVPEHYKDTEFWKREKAMSIDEEEIDIDAMSKLPKASSFEEASHTQNEAAISTLQQQRSKESGDNDESAATPDDKETISDAKSNT